jgi:hypothetical protein
MDGMKMSNYFERLVERKNQWLARKAERDTQKYIDRMNRRVKKDLEKCANEPDRTELVRDENGEWRTQWKSTATTRLIRRFWPSYSGRPFF